MKSDTLRRQDKLLPVEFRMLLWKFAIARCNNCYVRQSSKIMRKYAQLNGNSERIVCEGGNVYPPS